jgi:hypothetical protein
VADDDGIIGSSVFNNDVCFASDEKRMSGKRKRRNHQKMTNNADFFEGEEVTVYFEEDGKKFAIPQRGGEE